MNNIMLEHESCWPWKQCFDKKNLNSSSTYSELSTTVVMDTHHVTHSVSGFFFLTRE